MTIWRVGMRAVCIRDDFNDMTGGPTFVGFVMPRERYVYTVRDVVVHKSVPDVVFLRLVEIVNGTHPDGMFEPCFASGFFRPVAETKTDIFTRMLNPSPSPSRVSEDA